MNSLKKNKLIECNQIKDTLIYHSCPLGKHIKLPFYASNSSMSFDIIHSDLWTSPVLSSPGHRYYVLFVDDYSKFLWTFSLSQKSQTFSTFLHFKTFIRTQFECDIKIIQCDNDIKFDNGFFWDFCKVNGLSFGLSCPHTSLQNRKVERQIHTINNIVHTLLAHASLPPSFWHHVLQMTTYLLNILPHKLLNYQSPLPILYQKDPSYSHLQVFGCLCYPLIPTTIINKLQPWSTPCVFFRYLSHHRGYKCFDLSSRKIIISRHVLFDETQFPFAKIHTYQFLDDGSSPYMVHHFNTPINPQVAPFPPSLEPNLYFHSPT